MTPDECDECFRRALTRVAIVLNGSTRPELVSLLCKSDIVLQEVVAAADLKNLFGYVPGHADGQLAFSEYASFFYGVTKVLGPNNDGIRTVEHRTRPAFTQLFRKGEFPPRYTDIELGLDPLSVEAPREHSLAFATNYLVKNLWHNVVHVLRQEINESNFPEFVGQARETSDFTADNLAAIMHVLSYGLRIEAASANAPLAPDDEIVYLQRRNRCNGLFAERAKVINRVDPERYDETEHLWRLRRVIAVYVSGWLIAVGRAAATLSVQFTRQMSDTERALAIEVNGVFFALDIPVKVAFAGAPDHEKRLIGRDELRTIARRFDERYVATLERRPDLAQYAREALATQLRAFGIDASAWLPRVLEVGNLPKA